MRQKQEGSFMMRGWPLLLVILILVAAACSKNDPVEEENGETRGETSIQIVIQGNGSGVVTHDLGPAECRTGTCTWNFTPGLTVILTATPDSGSVFTGWGGDCSSAGTGGCTLTVDRQFDITATFNAFP